MPETMLQQPAAPAMTWVDGVRSAIFRRDLESVPYRMKNG